MKEGHKAITALGSGLLLLALLAYPIHAQSSGPNSGPMPHEARDPMAEPPLTYPTQGQSSGLRSGPVPEGAGDPLTEPAPGELAAPTLEPSGAPSSAEGAASASPRRPMVPEKLPASIQATTAVVDFRISGSTLRPRSSDVDWGWGSGGGCMYAKAGNSFTIFNTSLHLPQGSNILAMRMYYDDTSSSDSVGWFSIYNLYGELVDEWAVTSVGDTGNGFNDTEVFSHTIDYLSYSYVLNWRPGDLGSDTQLCGFRLFLEPPPFTFSAAFMPLVLRE